LLSLRALRISALYALKRAINRRRRAPQRYAETWGSRGHRHSVRFTAWRKHRFAWQWAV